MSEILPPADRDRPPSRPVLERTPSAGASPASLWVFVLALLLLALLAGSVVASCWAVLMSGPCLRTITSLFCWGARLADDEGYVILMDVVPRRPAFQCRAGGGGSD